MKILFTLNDPPYGTERSYNGLRLAETLARRHDTEVKVFLVGDAVGCAHAGQTVPQGWYRLDRMLDTAARHGTAIGCCGTCLDARGIADDALVESAHRSSLDEWAEWSAWADKIITF